MGGGGWRVVSIAKTTLYQPFVRLYYVRLRLGWAETIITPKAVLLHLYKITNLKTTNHYLLVTSFNKTTSEERQVWLNILSSPCLPSLSALTVGKPS